MNSQAYTALAKYYDALTQDVSYDRFADYYEAQFRYNELAVRSILDVACGTGVLTCLLARRGYDMIGADISEDMLMSAQDNAAIQENRPLFLNQSMEELDLYGTVDAIVCSLDGVNYVSSDKLKEAFRRILLFLEPGGLFIFDIQPPAFLRAQDGQINLDETDDVYCVWRAHFDEQKKALIYAMDLFALEGRRWSRYCEEHVEYVYEPLYLEALLHQTGFYDVRIFGDMTFEEPRDDKARVFITARKPAQ